MELNETKTKKIKQIKTICARVEFASNFDETVNLALAAGWYLVKRYTLPAYTSNINIMLVAELQRYVYD